jgi:hypothetical protein
MSMAALITLKIRLGPLLTIVAEGSDCQELQRALEGWEKLNVQVEGLCSDLAERMYPDGVPDDEVKGTENEI